MSIIKGPGLLYVNSRITSHQLSELQFLNWYTTVHIPEILDTAGVSSALRFKSPVPDTQKPYLTIYPMNDIGFTQTDEFKQITVTSEILPQGEPIYNLADFDTRYYGLVQYFEPNEVKAGQTRMLLTGGFSFSTREDEHDCDEWYRKEHLEQVSKTPGYLRTTRWKLLYHRNNAISRQLKGFPPHPEDAAALEEPPTFLALHEFDRTELDFEALKATGETEWAKRVMASTIKTETPVFIFKEYFGTGLLFDEAMRRQYSGSSFPTTEHTGVKL